MRIDEIPDPDIQAALASFTQEKDLDPVHPPRERPPAVAAPRTEGAGRDDAYASFREQWLSLGWEEIQPLLFAKRFPEGMDPEVYCMFAFGGMPLGQKIAWLRDMVAGSRTTEVYWPLVGQVFSEMPDGENPDLDLDSIANLIIDGFRLLPKELQSAIRQHELSTNIWRVLDSCVADWQIRVVREIGGEAVAGPICAETELIQWLGLESPERIWLQLDLRKDVPVPPASAHVISDGLGMCNCDPGSPSITLSLEAIRDVARRAGTLDRVADWRKLVLIHKEASLLYMTASDAAGRRNAILSSEWVSKVAGYIAFRWASQNGQRPLYDLLARALPKWPPVEQISRCDTEVFRFYLWLSRHIDNPDAIYIASQIRRTYPELPTIRAYGALS